MAELVTVRGERELAARAGHLFADVRSEFVCAATDLDTWSRPEVRAGIAERMRCRLGGGVTVRKLYTPAALADEEQRRHLQELVTYGAQVRISPAALPHETIAVDWRAVILAGPRHWPGAERPAGPQRSRRPLPKRSGDREFTVITSPGVIDAVRSLFEGTWQAAVPLPDYLGQDLPRLDPDGQRILTMLAAGLTDQAAARQLGISVRTYRRRVAELMKLLAAESRFQAGVRAGELGLTR
jgi:DNA-binding CsgD family transcriptional regulator